MLKQIDLSIIIIGYNVEKYIERCLKSILLQSKENVEIIFVDDGSKDNTRKIVNKIFDGYKNCKYYYKENGGANSARIYGYDKSRGEYITFVDGDDEVEANYMDVILDEIQKNKFDIFVFNYYNKKISGEKKINTLHKEKNYEEYEFLDDIITSKISHYLWNKVYSKNVLEKSNFLNIPKITMGDDLIANIKIGLEKPKVKSINSTIYNYYINENSVSRKMNSKYLEMLIVLQEMQNLISIKGLMEQYKSKIDFQYFRTFLLYVVRNKYKTTNIQKSIYAEYKKRKIIINKNEYIKDWIDQRDFLEKVLTKLYLKNYYIGYIVSRVYVIYNKLRSR